MCSCRLVKCVSVYLGCNTGIGKEVAIDMARRGARVYMACRNSLRGRKAQEEIINLTKNEGVFFIQCDLASFSSIRTFVKE